jgi:hypothetical protein
VPVQSSAPRDLRGAKAASKTKVAVALAGNERGLKASVFNVVMYLLRLDRRDCITFKIQLESEFNRRRLA